MSEQLTMRLQGLLGRELGPSAWVEVDQGTVDRFANATGDRQWIHIDAKRARAESPFGGTVAHGMFTIGLAPALAIGMLGLEQAALVVNYGLNRVRFPAPLLVGSRVRMRLSVTEVEPLEESVRLTFDVGLEDDRQEKPVCVAQFVFLLYE
jgi:acyl dehydratase